ncbi:hypothetical protein TRAPUB_2345 [Trametes pubescens]|uniref:Uncharacterized protein n=1 Tax=Trametes pubescens TaxID=154538 RepID=A0A1M2VGW4_TRAPU|nr:hypothetical protein TRAPUB_2345 [Trametes pubescens]
MPRPFAESTLLTLLSLLRIACGAILTIDDADPRIQYTGAWVPNTGGDPQQLNYMATLTYSNVTGTIASFQFTGSAVAVYGAFGPVGTFDMRSEYSIDRGPPTVFLPPNDIAAVAHRRQFFASGEIKYGPHVLTIENMGEQFWLDYIQVEVPDDVGTTSAATATSSTNAQTSARGGSSTSDVVSPASPDNVASTAPTSPSGTSAATSPPAQSPPHNQAAPTTHTTASLTLSPVPDVQSSTSTDASVEPQTSAPTPSNSQASGGGSNDGQRLSVGSPTMMPGAIAGVAVAGAVLLLGILVVAQWWRKRRWNGGCSAEKGIAALGEHLSTCVHLVTSTLKRAVLDRPLRPR